MAYGYINFQLMTLNSYLNQLMEDQDEVMEILMPDSVENNESAEIKEALL